MGYKKILQMCEDTYPYTSSQVTYGRSVVVDNYCRDFISEIIRYERQNGIDPESHYTHLYNFPVHWSLNRVIFIMIEKDTDNVWLYYRHINWEYMQERQSIPKVLLRA